MSGERGTQRLEGRLGGLRWEAEPCPDASEGDRLRGALIGGGAGLLSGLLLRLPPSLRLLALAGGALVGRFAAGHHLNLDWDPDAAFGAGGAAGQGPAVGNDPSPEVRAQ
ncbi:MAG: hypothetical protein D6731_23630 [Planctomycetota bacterium]|nr:MAG: hypothetical protein D6731_23630 [Planctomycetota bacterium]